MDLDSIVEYLRERLKQPGRLVWQIAILWWLWSSLRDAIRRKTQKPEGASPQAGEGATHEQRPAEPPAPPSTAREERRSPGPAGDGATATRARAGAERVQSPAPKQAASEARPRRGRAEWDRALGEADGLRAAVSDRRELRWLEPIVVSEIIEPFQALRDRAVRGGAPSPELERRGEDAFELRELLRRALAERANPNDAERLAEADALAEAFQAPLRAYADREGLAWRGRRMLALRTPLPAAVARTRTRPERAVPAWTRELALMPVPAAFGTDLAHYFDLIEDLGRRWYFALTDLPVECQQRLDLAPRLRLPAARGGYDPSQIRACFGPWLPALFADTTLSLAHGTGYVSALGRQLRRTAQPTAASAEGPFLSREPPALLRLHAAWSALSALDQHAAVERQKQQFRVAFPDLERSTLPLADGGVFVLSSDDLLALGDPIVTFLRDAPLAALGGIPLHEIDELVQSAERAHEQVRLADQLPQRLLTEHRDPALLFGAASIAIDRGADPARVLVQFRTATAPRHQPPPSPAPRPTGRPRSLQEALRDHGFLLSAGALGAAFERPRATRRRLGRR